MPSQQCLNNIKAEQPPFNKACTDALCQKMNASLTAHCQTAGLPLDTPIMSFDPALNSPCYCCCSCYTLNTPIEATKGEFILIQNINAGDSILTAGVDLKWTPGIVKARSGDIHKSMIPGLYLVRYQMTGESELRDLLVTADHLFLMHSTRQLKKVQHLIPGNKLTAADGSYAEVQFVAHGEYDTAIQSINMKGDFNGKDLTGHLINANGIVSTDYAVQAYYETHNLTDSIRFNFSNEAKVFDVGSPEYSEQFPSKLRDEFLSDPTLWPKGFSPKREPLINIPANAKGFVNADQALDIYNNATFNAYSNGVPRESINRLFKMFSGYDNNITYLLDWNNEEVNAFTWTMGNQKYLLLTGGLARIQELYVSGWALIIADMVMHLQVNKCVAEVDYASLDVLRAILPNSMYGETAPSGITQIKDILFSKISKKNAGGNPGDICDDPSIECRIQSFWNGLSFFPAPTCGTPPDQYFYLVKGYSSIDLKTVNVVFDKPVDPASATSLVNYNIEPGVVISAAVVSVSEPGTVILTVSGIAAASKYILSVTNVTSADGQSLGEGAYVIIATP
ncbi:hypothetical protein [Pedobacter cryoconitis]|uniref:Hint domain-containing protein n=1 Tax=Pedobacter cryoconitis TaxID=188932 RepID=A0A7X0MH79_9SPHI|nr:hypothetical protein [Pedobacter cryoconitis]MBB6498859.1 hypothetical protein [Pedobacter cryoconitis]